MAVTILIDRTQGIYAFLQHIEDIKTQQILRSARNRNRNLRFEELNFRTIEEISPEDINSLIQRFNLTDLRRDQGLETQVLNSPKE